MEENDVPYKKIASAKKILLWQRQLLNRTELTVSMKTNTLKMGCLTDSIFLL